MLDNYHQWDQVSSILNPQILNPSQVAACAYICEMTHGYENEVLPIFPFPPPVLEVP